MKEQIVSFETAKLLKKVGFIGFCRNYYSKAGELKEFSYYEGDGTGINSLNLEDDYLPEDFYILAPTQSLAQKFLREKYGIQIVQITEHLETKIRPYTYKLNGYEFQIHKIEYDQGDIKYTGVYNTYEQALEKGLQEAIKIIKDDN